MRLRIFTGLFLSLFGTSLLAQNQVGCEQLLEDAREAYNGGMVELVPEILNPCLESGLIGEPLREGYRLVINAYIFDYLPEAAAAKMQDFIREFPDYTPVNSDTREFIQLFEAKKEEIERESARNRQEELERLRREAEANRQREQQARQQDTGEGQRTTERQEHARVQPQGTPHSMGLTLGGIMLFPKIIERYSLTDPSTDAGDYGLTTPGIMFGAVLNLNLGRSLNLGLGLNFNRLHMNYSGKPFTYMSVQYDEYHNRIGIPVSLAVDFNPDGRTVGYFRFGVTADYLLGASASAIRTYEESGDSFFPDVEVESLSITDARIRLNFCGEAGLGLKYKTGNGIFFVEATYQYGFRKVNIGEHRFETQDLNWLIYYLDSDFRIQQVGLSAGLAWNL
jgi:hypothetical protein